jgi:Rod binding domain-containing protein
MHGTFQISSGSIRSFRARAYQFFTSAHDSRPEYGELEMSDLTLSPVTQSPLTPRREAELRGAAQELEAAFLSEMLRHGGLGTPRDSFGGGHGEDQFASFLRTEQARAMAAGGGIGLAESLFNALAARDEPAR